MFVRCLIPWVFPPLLSHSGCSWMLSSLNCLWCRVRAVRRDLIATLLVLSSSRLMRSEYDPGLGFDGTGRSNVLVISLLEIAGSSLTRVFLLPLDLPCWAARLESVEHIIHTKMKSTKAITATIPYKPSLRHASSTVDILPKKTALQVQKSR